MSGPTTQAPESDTRAPAGQTGTPIRPIRHPGRRRSQVGARASAVAAIAVGIVASGALLVIGVAAVAAVPAGALLGVVTRTVLRPPPVLQLLARRIAGPESAIGVPLLLLPRVLVGGAALWIVVLMAVNPAGDLARYGPQSGSGYTPSLVLILVLLLLLLLPSYWRLAVRFGNGWDQITARRQRLVGTAAAAVVLAVQFTVAIGTSKVPGFDAGGIITSSWEHANSPTGMSVDPSDYYSLLPNNAFLGYAFYVFFLALRLVGVTSAVATLTAAVLLNALVLSAGTWITLVVARRLGGTSVSFFVLPALLLFVVFSPWLNTPYSDTLGLVFPIAALYCFLKWRGARTTRSMVVSCALLGILAAVGGALKPTTLLPIALIALAMLVERPPSLRGRSFGALTGLAATAAVYVAAHLALLAGIASSGLVHFDVFHDPNALPFTHLMVFGSQGYGGYDQSVIDRTLAMAPDERFSRNLDLYVANVSALHLPGYAAFLGNKVLWMLGDGTFFQGREGDTATDWFFSDPVSLTIQSFFPNGTPGHAPMASVWQAGWIVVLCCVALWLLVRPHRAARSAVAVAQWSLIALVLFLLLSEGRARYVYLDVPLVVLLAGLAVQRMSYRLGQRIAVGAQIEHSVRLDGAAESV